MVWQRLADLLVRRLFWVALLVASCLMLKYALDIHNGLEAARIYCDCKQGVQFYKAD